MACHICNNPSLDIVLSLGRHPPSDAFLTKEQLDRREPAYPLDLYFCTACNLVQLGYTVDPKELFPSDYAFNTATNKQLVTNFRALVEHLVNTYNLTPSDLAIDIGSNDGSLLEGYKPHGVRVLGVEPTGVASMAEAKRIPVVNQFFNERVANDIRETHGKAKIITAMNLFPHVDDLHGFVNGVRTLLTTDGVFISDSHHLLSLITQMQYDSIYHEHLRYYSIKPLVTLFAAHDMDVIHVETIPNHGGSIRVYAAHKGAYPINPSVQQVMAQEERAGLYKKETFIRYASHVAALRDNLVSLLQDIKRKDNRIVGIGAPAKGNTLLNYCKITPDLLDYLAEYSTLKIGKYAPGTHIPVVHEERLFTEQPPYALLLSWNLTDVIVPKLRAKGYTGKIIIPCPEPRIIS